METSMVWAVANPRETLREPSDPVDEALARSESTFRSPRMFDAQETDATEGIVRWKPVKSLWIGSMTLTALIGGPMYFTWGALALFVATTATTVCLGHSLGMHRRLIHRAYDCPLWLERLFVYLGRWAWPGPTA
jgi:fatty-acid desaturase